MLLRFIFVFFLLLFGCICFAADRYDQKKQRLQLDLIDEKSSTPGSPSTPRTETPTQTNPLRRSTTSWDGEFYDTHGSLQQRWARGVLASYPFPQNSVALDIGCGNGLVTQEEIFPLVGEGNLTGIDPSEEMIAVAEKRTIPEKLVFRTGSAEGTGFAPNTFGSVTCFSTLHWVERKDLAIREAAHILKPNGLYYVYMWVRDTKDPIRQAFEGTARSEKWFESLTPHGFFPEALPGSQGKFKEPYHMTRRNKINEALKSAGFEILVWEPHMSSEVFKTGEDLKDWLLGWSQFGCLGERHEEFLRDVVKNYLIITEQSGEDEIIYHDAKLRFVARKSGAT